MSSVISGLSSLTRLLPFTIPQPRSTHRRYTLLDFSRVDSAATVPGVTAGAIRPEIKVIGAVARAGGGQLNPAAGELDVMARWGVAGKGGVCMPSTGRLTERDYSADERAALVQGAAALGLDEAAALACLGGKTFDVYLNGVAFWRNVPAQVWAYTLGGYQVTKKWLSYREKALLAGGHGCLCRPRRARSAAE